jgi:hypothetical protein
MELNEPLCSDGCGFLLGRTYVREWLVRALRTANETTPNMAINVCDLLIGNNALICLFKPSVHKAHKNMSVK